MRDTILEKFGDHGADSSRRDRFQEHYAAQWCLKMLSDTSISEVICEYGEDIVINKNGIFELHQVKTKQESVDEWKLADLIPIIGKTFAMAPYFGEVSRCCFISNKGATGTLLELKKLLGLPQGEWNNEEVEYFNNFCKNYSRNILNEITKVDPDTTITVEDIPLLLIKLNILTDFHHMNRVGDTNIRNLRKHLEINGHNHLIYTDLELEELYDKLIGIVGKATIGRTKEEKTIDHDQVLGCIKHPRFRKTLYSFPTKQEIDSAPGRTILEKKLNLGGFTSLFIGNAREEMVSVMHQSRTWDFGQASELLEDIKFRVRHLCIDNYDRVCTNQPGKERLGRLILDEITKDLPRLIDYYNGANLPFIDEIFLRGIAMSLTSECKLYWSQHQPGE